MSEIYCPVLSFLRMLRHLGDLFDVNTVTVASPIENELSSDGTVPVCRPPKR